LSHCTYLCHEQAQAAGLRFLASPCSRGNSPNSAFQGKKKSSPTELFFQLIFQAAPEDVAAFNAAAQAAAEAGGVDVLLTHSSCSSATVASLNVKVHAWGHIHNHYGVRLVQKQEQWLDVCACSVDGEYAHTHGVVLVDIPQSS
jgi:hypothetical protein